MKRSEYLQDKMGEVRAECVRSIKNILATKKRERINFSTIYDTPPVLIPYDGATSIFLSEIYIDSGCLYIKEENENEYNAEIGDAAGVPLQTLINILEFIED